MMKTTAIVMAGLLIAFTAQLKAESAFYSTGNETGPCRLKIAVPGLGLEGPYLRDANNSGPYLGDLNNDGAMDILVSPWGLGYDHTAPASKYGDIYYNRKGSFPSKADRRLILGLRSCLIGDFDGDGKDDLAVARGDAFSVFLGSMNLAQNVGTSDLRSKAGGWVDLPYGLSDYGKLSVQGESIDAKLCDFVGGARWRRMATTDSGSTFTQGVFLPADYEQWVDSRMADLDGDSNTDVVVVSKQLKGYEGPGTNQVFEQDLIKIRLYYGPFPSMQVRPEELKHYTEITLPGNEATTPLALIAVADMNQDGKSDLVLASGDKTLIFHQNPAGGFSQNADPSQVITDTDRRSCVADVNHDGLPDLVVGRSQAGEIAILLNKGGVIAAKSAAEADQKIPCPQLQAIEMADLNGDKWPDIAARVNQGLVIFFNTQGKALAPESQAAVATDDKRPAAKTSGPAIKDLMERAAPPSDDAYMMPYYTGNIYPTPQEAVYGDEYIPLADVGVLVGQDVTNPAPLVAVLTERIRRYGGQANVEEAFNNKHNAWITLGHTAAGDKVATIPEIPDRPEGYVLASGNVDGKPVVVLRGRDQLGLLWAISSFNQLVHVQDGKTMVRSARVRDYPIALHRGYLGGGSGEDGLLLSVPYNIAFKFNNPVYNGLAFSYLPIDLPNMSFRDIENQPSFQGEFIRQFGKTLTPLGIKWYAGMHPYHCPMEYKASAAPEDLDILMKYADMVAREGGNFLILSDDSRTYMNPFDSKAFGCASRADVHMLNTLVDRIGVKYPDTRFMFCPMWYFGLMGDGGLEYSWYGESPRKYSEYFGSHLSEKVDMFWTGPRVTSTAANNKELTIVAKIWRRKPAFWQNGISQNHPTDPITSWPNWMNTEFLENTKGYMINMPSYIVAATLADYCWNPSAYNPERSIQEALGKLAGPENFEPMRRAQAALVCFQKYGGQIQAMFNQKYQPCRDAAREIETLEAKLAEAKAINDEIFSRQTGARVWVPGVIPSGYEMFVNRTKSDPALALFLKTGDQKRRAIKEAGLNPTTDVFMASCSLTGGDLVEDKDMLSNEKRIAAILSGLKRSVRTEFTLQPTALSNAWTLVISARAGEQSESCPIKIMLNDTVVHQGATPFVSTDWALGTFEVPAHALGTNSVVSIESQGSGDKFSPEPDLKIDYVFLKHRQIKQDESAERNAAKQEKETP